MIQLDQARPTYGFGTAAVAAVSSTFGRVPNKMAGKKRMLKRYRRLTVAMKS